MGTFRNVFKTFSITDLHRNCWLRNENDNITKVKTFYIRIAFARYEGKKALRF